ncbi:MAG TPA: tripartite tricarboxylate transporter substrate-binding protein [Burkholderiales bacterium]|nr:tripartite tricarboxylate transporter substrate-binding protein [Burkholderiales bacterium]
MKTRTLVMSVVAAVVCIAAGSTAAQQFPQKPLRWISPYSAGGGSDLTTRAVAKKLGEFLGQNVVVDNRTGASGKIAVELASHAPADGYTLVTFTPSISANQDISHLAPLTQMTSQGYVWIVHPAIPATSMKELIALARARPGTLHYGSSGIATMQHMAGAMLGTMTHTDLVHVPYKGGAPALTDLLAGQLQFFAADLWSSVPHIKSNRVRALAVTSGKRSTVFPDLPTTSEAGVPGYAVENWYGVATHGKTPPDILLRLNRELVRALRSPEVHGRIAQEGANMIGNSAAEFAAIIRHDVRQWHTVAREAGISNP